ncbi:hypothetical protein TKK_0003191 [Trichogramma kaykai]
MSKNEFSVSYNSSKLLEVFGLKMELIHQNLNQLNMIWNLYCNWLRNAEENKISFNQMMQAGPSGMQDHKNLNKTGLIRPDK